MQGNLMKQRRLGPKLPRRGRATSCRPRRACFERLEARQVLSAPSLTPIGPIELLSGSPLHIPLDALDTDGDTLTFTATSSNPSVTTYIPEGNRSMKIAVRSDDGAIDGDMILELYEDLVPRVTSRIIELAESGFYDGVIFHRVMNGFMIQTGDPTGTGKGGSAYPDFDDQFHVDLQHNTTGVLSMAKSSDDTNNSQFFILDTPATGADYPRNLDFNHSIFGQLVEGFDVLEAISGVAVHQRPGSNPPEYSVPDVDVVMESVQIFVDNENGVLMLKAPEGYTGEADITVTVSDGHGGEDQIVFHVTVTPDPVDSDPYFAEVPEIRIPYDEPVTLTAIDVEGNNSYFLYEGDLAEYHLDIPLWCNEDLDYITDISTGEVTVAANNGLVGIHPITLATGVYADAIDYQVVPVFIVPDEAPTSRLDITLVRDLTEVDEMGEVDSLPDDQWIDEWDCFAIEIWATVTTPGAFGVHTVSTDLLFDKALFVATRIEHGLVFAKNQTGQIDNSAGAVTDVGGTTGVFTIDGYPDYYSNDPENPGYSGSPSDPVDVNLYGDNRPVLVARVYFEPNRPNLGVPHNAYTDYLAPHTDLGFALAGGQVTWSSVDVTTLTLGTLQNPELWPVMYDLDDDGEIGLGDLSFFAAAYNHTVGEPGGGLTWASDFDHDGDVGLGDLSYFASVYGHGEYSPSRLNYSPNFPAAWRPTTEGAALMGTVVAGSDDGDASEADGGSGTQSDVAFAQAIWGPHRPQSTARRKIDAVDLVMRFYDR